MLHCGVCEKEMFGANPDENGLVVCGSCVMAPLPPRFDKADEASLEDSNFDLSFLSNSQEGQRDKLRDIKRKSVYEVTSNLGKLTTKTHPTIKEEPVKLFKLKSNSVRDRMHPVGSLMLRFDGDGVAKVAEAHLEEVKAHMALRPGRFRILDEEPRAQKKNPQKSLAEAREALEKAQAGKQEKSQPKKEEDSKPEPAPKKKEQPKPKKVSVKKTDKKKEDSSSDDK